MAAAVKTVPVLVIIKCNRDINIFNTYIDKDLTRVYNIN